jgi:hypothetical protein
VVAAKLVASTISALVKGSGIDIRRQQQQAREWFRKKAADVGKLTTNKLFEEKDRLHTNFKAEDIGRMFLFYYDPKHKKTLPYYDKFPAIFVVDVDSTGFTGLNLHYLPPYLRAWMMDELNKIKTDRKFDNNTKLKVTYQLLSSTNRFRYFKPCFKRYLWTHVRSKFIRVESAEWELVAFLPLQQFEKSGQEQIWRDSARKVL